MKLAKIFFFSIFVISICDCSVQKRHYSKGYYFSYENKKNIKSGGRHPLLRMENSDPELVLAGKAYSEARKKISGPEDSCDVIVLKNGQEKKAIVTEINQKEVKFKNCDNLDGPIYGIYKHTVFMIKYKNGSREIIKETEPVQQRPITSTTVPQAPAEKKMEIFSLASFVTALGSRFTISLPEYVSGGLALAAIVCGAIGLVRISRHEDLYKGKAFAIIGLVLGLIFAIVILLGAILSLRVI